MVSHALRPWHVSFLTHISVVGTIYALTLIQSAPTEYIEVPIEVSAPQEVQNLTQVQEKPKVVLKTINTPEIAPKTETREVFGASRNSYTDEEGGSVEAKKGNTLAKEADSEVLKDTDADSLPTPTEEFLVSEMPSVLSEVRPVYPKEARERKLEGDVVMDVLIDEKGLVRQLNVISGEPIFRASATEAMKKFKFRPAKVDAKSVSVRVRYTLHFKTEY